MKDANFALVKALPNAGANNQTTILDLGIEPPSGGVPSSKWRRAHIEVSVPNLANHTNTSATITITLQAGNVNAAANMANTSPLISIPIAGVANGPNATTYKVPIPPNCARYVRFDQTATANSGTDNANISYDLVT